MRWRKSASMPGGSLLTGPQQSLSRLSQAAFRNAIGNAGPVEPVHALGAKPPLLLMSADEDAALEGMMRLDDELTQDGWRHESYSRAGTHELTDQEIEAALAFFARVREEKGTLSPAVASF